MELEQWLKHYDIEKMAMRNLNIYLEDYKKNEEEYFNEDFKDVDFSKMEYNFHSVSYVINKWHAQEGEERKYIMAKVRLEYDDAPFAEYRVVYDLDGIFEDDYFTSS